MVPRTSLEKRQPLGIMARPILRWLTYQLVELPTNWCVESGASRVDAPVASDFQEVLDLQLGGSGHGIIGPRHRGHRPQEPTPIAVQDVLPALENVSKVVASHGAEDVPHGGFVGGHLGFT